MKQQLISGIVTGLLDTDSDIHVDVSQDDHGDMLVLTGRKLALDEETTLDHSVYVATADLISDDVDTYVLDVIIGHHVEAIKDVLEAKSGIAPVVAD